MSAEPADCAEGAPATVMFNRSTEIALVAMSRLAEEHATDRRPLTAARIAADRHVSKPYVAKVLTVLSQRGLVQGSPGRHGGYFLARAPAEITLFDIAECFERFDRPSPCPFGPNRCGSGAKCPLHDDIAAIQDQIRRFLADTTLAVFTG